jgi:hypothetical protein
MVTGRSDVTCLIAVLALVGAGCVEASHRVSQPFVSNGGLEGGLGSGLWGDTSSGPSGMRLGCISGRHFQLAITLRNRSTTAVTLTGARGSEPAPRIIRRVAVQFRLAPPPAARRPHCLKPSPVERVTADRGDDPARQKRGRPIELPDGTLRGARPSASVDRQPRDRRRLPGLQPCGPRADCAAKRAHHPHAGTHDPAVLASTPQHWPRRARRFVQDRSDCGARLPSILVRPFGGLLGGGVRLGVHVHAPDGIRVARALLAWIEEAVAEDSLDRLRRHLRRRGARRPSSRASRSGRGRRRPATRSCSSAGSRRCRSGRGCRRRGTSSLSRLP